MNPWGQHLKTPWQGISLSCFSSILEVSRPQSVVHSITEKVPSKHHKGIGVFTFQNTENPPSHPKFLIAAENLAVPGGSSFLFPSNLQALPSTMKAVSKGHLAKSRCREGYPGFVHMSLAGVHPGRQKHETPVPKLIRKSPSRREGGWDHLCLSGNHEALH